MCIEGRRKVIELVCTVVVCAVASEVGFSQEPIVVPSEPACPNCLIMFERVVTLGGISDPGNLSILATLVRDSEGRFYAGPTHNPGEIAVYSPQGEFIRNIGREGDGPGEYRDIFKVAVSPGDTLYVFDWGNGRLTVLSPTLEVVRTMLLPGVLNDVLFLGNGSILLSTGIHTEDRFGQPMHVLLSNGKITRSFGADEGGVVGRKHWNTHRSFAWADSGRFWAAPMNRYVLELWHVSGELFRRIFRDASWFQMWEEYAVPLRERPHPSLIDVQVDSSGRIWTSISVPDENWKPKDLQPGEREPQFEPGDAERIFDGIVEVIDPDAPRLVTSVRYPRVLQSLGDGEHFYSKREGELGEVYVDVLRARILER